MIDNLSAATPVEIDTQLAEIDRKLGPALTRLESARRHYAYQVETWGEGSYYAEQTAESVAAAQTRVDELNEQAAPLNTEYARRPWNRAWMVLNTNGHAHRDTRCSTCFDTTRFGWLPQVAGMDENEIVAALGSDACTVCYPTAPVEVLARPRTVFTAEEAEARAESEAKAAAKAAKAVARAAKAITNPDGTPLRLRGYCGEVKTERTAEMEYVDAAAYLMAVATGSPTGRMTEAQADTAAILAALAAKHGTAIDAERERLAPKVTARYRRDYCG